MAYLAQDRWLERFQSDLEKEFEIDKLCHWTVEFEPGDVLKMVHYFVN